MKKIRIGNDIAVNWTILDADSQPYILEGKDVRVFMDVQTSGKVRVLSAGTQSIEVTDFHVNDNVISFTYLGREQELLGNYILRFIENDGANGMVTYDLKDAFSIVAHSWLEGQGDTTTIETEVVNLTSQIDNTVMAELARKADKVEGATAGNVAILTEDGNLADGGMKPAGVHPYLSLERLRAYLYRVTFDTLPEDNGGDSLIVGGCSSYVQDGKLYTNLDWDYSNTASFLVVTKDFSGQSFIGGLDDGMLDDALIAQLPYRVHRGSNNHSIKVATHVLFNDWEWTGAGSRSINITRLPFEVLSRVKSMATIASDLSGVLGNLYCPEGLASMGYLVQVLVTDGTTTYAILPPTSEGQGFILQDITSNPKMTNFRWVGRAQVERTDSDIQERPTGIERFNLMPCPLEDLRFTKCYESADRLSEFIGVYDTTKDASDAQLEAIYLEARALYLDRQRDGRTWQTMESAVYGDKMESLWIQENWQDNIITAGGGGVSRYSELPDKPQINGNTLSGDKSASELGLATSSDVAGKQDVIPDLQPIREGAALGATAVQPSELNDYYDKTETDSMLGEKVDKVAGKGLSTNDYTTADKNKLAGLSNYDDSGVKGRLDAIEAKEDGWDAKQDAISDLTAIRTGAGKGATALQPSDIVNSLESTASDKPISAHAVNVDMVDYIDQSITDTMLYIDQQDASEHAGRVAGDNLLDARITAIEGKESGWDAKADVDDIPNVIDSVTSTSTADALSAKQGKALNDRINNILGRGRFLSFWDATTGMPLTNPSGYPYEYNTGDYFIVNKVGATNYIPNGSSYIGVPSTTVYTGDLKPNDSIYYDGTQWSVFDTPAGSGDIQDVYQNGESVVSNGIAYVVTPTELKDLTGDTTHRVVTDVQIAAWGGKQDAISDLAAIRSNAAAGKTASDNLSGHTVAKNVPADAKFTDTVYDDTALKGRVSTIEGKESGWDSKYSKPSSGIPKTDLASGVRSSLDKADSALQEHQSLAAYRTSAQQDVIDAEKEDSGNKVTSISSSSTDNQYPSAKCVYDAIISTINTPV